MEQMSSYEEFGSDRLCSVLMDYFSGYDNVECSIVPGGVSDIIVARVTINDKFRLEDLSVSEAILTETFGDDITFGVEVANNDVVTNESKEFVRSREIQAGKTAKSGWVYEGYIKELYDKVERDRKSGGCN